MEAEHHESQRAPSRQQSEISSTNGIDPGEVARPGATNPGSPVHVETGTGLPDLDHFEQQVIQADLDRDPFAVALFEVKPLGPDSSSLLPRLARCLLDFASPSTHVAYLGRGRLAILTRTTDTTHRWVAPVATALQSALDAWLDEPGADGRPRRAARGHDHGDRPVIADLVGSVDVSDLADRPRLISGAARGLTKQVWPNAEAALMNAYRRRLSFVEHRGGNAEPMAGAHRPTVAAPARRQLEPEGANGSNRAADDERLVVLSHRLQPVDRPEPEWLWLRLEPGLQTNAGSAAHTIDPGDLNPSERAMLEIWLANQIGPIFAEASTQLRLTIPITAEAGRARSFAQRIFPILEQHRIPPSRLVVEIDDVALVAEQPTDEEAALNGTQPSARRFVEDAAAMDVSVVIGNFDGGWISWRAVQDLPIDYLKPPPELVRRAGAGDDEALRSLHIIGADAERRGIELIVPDVATALSPRDLAQVGFSYREGETATVSRALTPPKPAEGRQAAGSRPQAS